MEVAQMIRIKKRAVLSSVFCLVFCGLSLHSGIDARDVQDTWPRSVLITNDDGINETRIWALGQAFARVTQTYIVASYEDRSGSTNSISLGKYNRSLFAGRVYAGKNLEAYGLRGYPADCVLFGVKGLLKDNPPDLVVSGVNGGSNLGSDAWFGSGTIGAARAAAFLNIPAIAVSGLDDDDEEMVKFVTEWVVSFSQSRIVRELENGEYLTVSIPEISPSEIKGIKIVNRAPSFMDYRFRKIWEKSEENGDETEEVWLAEEFRKSGDIPEDTDVYWYLKGYIVIVPMSIGENDQILLKKMQERKTDIPEWPIK